MGFVGEHDYKSIREQIWLDFDGDQNVKLVLHVRQLSDFDFTAIHPTIVTRRGSNIVIAGANCLAAADIKVIVCQTIATSRYSKERMDFL